MPENPEAKAAPSEVPDAARSGAEAPIDVVRQQPLAAPWAAEAPTATRASPPDLITVYVSSETVVNHPANGFEARSLPVARSYAGAPACFVAVYSRQAAGAAYGLGGGLWVHGLIRVKGIYDDAGIAQPSGYEGKDISASQDFKELANANFPSAGPDSWVGGDTAGFLALLGPT